MFPVLAAALIGGAASLIGSQLSSAQSQRQAASQQQFQEAMSNSAYQRAVRDMQGAGLNPMLAYHLGGASTPSGAQGTVFDAGRAVSEGFSAGAGVARSVEQTELYSRQAEESSARAAESRSMVKVNEARAADISERLRVLMPQEHAALAADIVLKGQEARWVYERFLHEADKRGLTQVEIQAALLELPHLRNMSAAESSWFKREVSPYLKDVGEVVGTATSAAGAYVGARVGRGGRGGQGVLPPRQTSAEYFRGLRR
jgi:hypothetical protein